MKETPKRRITVTSSLNEIAMNQLGNRAVAKGRGVTPSAAIPFYSRFLDKYLKTR
jgi:hypothetical protein